MKFRSSRSQMFFKIVVLKNSQMSVSFFNKGPQACNFIKMRLEHKCFPVKFAKLLRAPFFTEHLQWLLLTVSGFQFATLLKKRLPQKCFSFSANFLRTPFDRTCPDDCFLSFTCEFFKNTSFIEHLSKTAYFMYKLQNFKQRIR